MVSNPLKILFVTAECAPYAKVGGLADVAAALPKQLRRMGHDARIVLPRYAQIDGARHRLRPDGSACVHMGGGIEHWIGVQAAELADEVPVSLIDFADYYGRTGIYDDESGAYADNAYRFGLLCKAAMQLCKDRGFVPDVMHLQDWPTAPAAALLKTWDREQSPLSSTASVLTIHNIGHQGKFGVDAFGYLGIGAEHFHSNAFEDYGQINLLKAGIAFADAITTVSPTHLREILEPDGGHGLAPYLSNRREDLTGILNGADYEIWNPEIDPLLPANYGRERLAGKARCKAALQHRLGLAIRAEVPLFGVVSRFAHQKGFDLMREALPDALGEMELQIAVLGSGDRGIESFFRWLSWTFPGRVATHVGYSDELSHQIEAGSDFFLMPSLYEPCGLNQIYSLKYGTLPVVRSTGGLEDSVEHYDEATGDGTGFKFREAEGWALYHAIGLAVATWWDRPQHIALMRQRAMAKDFSWEASAREYVEIYRHAIVRRKAWE